MSVNALEFVRIRHEEVQVYFFVSWLFPYKSFDACMCGRVCRCVAIVGCVGVLARKTAQGSEFENSPDQSPNKSGVGCQESCARLSNVPIGPLYPIRVTEGIRLNHCQQNSGIESFEIF